MTHQPEPAALFERDPGDPTVVVPTLLTRGPWGDQSFLHGSAVCGALGWVTEAAVADPALALARFTVEMRSMVPREPLATTVRVLKPGRRSRMIEASLQLEGQVVARATSQWVAHQPEGLVGLGAAERPPPLG